MGLSLDDLRALDSVAAAGSFARGAARLHVSQPTISERMARLERDLGVQLFHRDSRGARLTPAGHRLWPYAKRCLALVDEAQAAIHEETHRSRTRIAVHASFAPSSVPLMLEALAPLNVDASCIDAHSDEIMRLLDEGSIDVGLVVPCAHPGAIRVEPFRTDPVVCVATPTHPLAATERLHVRDLAAHAVAYIPWGDAAARFRELLGPATSPRIHPVSPADTVASLAGQGSHVGVLTRSTVANDLALGNLVELPVLDLPRWHITLALAYRREDAQSRPIQALRASLLPPGRVARTLLVPADHGFGNAP